MTPTERATEIENAARVLLQKQAFHRFSWYLWPVGAGFLAYLFIS